MFKDQNLIFTQFNKQGPTFTIRKWKPKDFDSNNGDVKGKEVKVEMNECLDSEYDKIIKGNTMSY